MCVCACFTLCSRKNCDWIDDCTTHNATNHSSFVYRKEPSKRKRSIDKDEKEFIRLSICFLTHVQITDALIYFHRHTQVHQSSDGVSFSVVDAWLQSMSKWNAKKTTTTNQNNDNNNNNHNKLLSLGFINSIIFCRCRCFVHSIRGWDDEKKRTVFIHFELCVNKIEKKRKRDREKKKPKDQRIPWGRHHQR